MKTRVKITLLVGLSVTVVLLLLLLIFNAGLHRQIDERARQAIGSSLSSDPASEDSPYYAEVTCLSDDGDMDLEGGYVSEADRQIRAWCSSHAVSTELQNLEIGGRRYYFRELLEETEEEGTIRWIAYVDVTNELQAVRDMNILFLLAAFLTGCTGSLVGYRVGRRLEDSAAAQKMFFENTSHELKTPLTAVRGYAEALQTGVVKDPAKAGRIISQQADKMSSLVEDILLLSRIEAGAQPLRREPVRIDECLENCLMPLEGSILDKGITLQLGLTPGRISADPERMDSAITNLLSNAVRYSSGRIEILCDEQRLKIWNDCDWADQEDIDHLFDRFYTGKRGSTGIGAALAKEIVQRHGFGIRAFGERNGIAVEIAFR